MSKTKRIFTFIIAVIMLSTAFMLPSYAVALSAPAKITSVQNTSAIKLTWSAVKGATGYRIYYKIPGDLTWRIALSSTKSTTYTFKNLFEGQHYIFAVRSYAKSGNKVTWGGHKEIKTATQTSAPAKLVAKSSTSAIKLTWSSVESACGYRIYYKTSASADWKVAVSETTKTIYTFKNLPEGKKYIFAVRGYSKSAIGRFYGKYATIEIATKSATKPEAPVVKVTSGNDYITLSWNKVNADGYRIYYKSGSSWVIAVSSTTKTSHTFNNLPEGKTYTLVVRPYIKTSDGNVIWGGYKAFTASTKATGSSDRGKVINSGKCGKNVTWTYYENATLVFSGTGDMQEYYNDVWYQPSNVLIPWYAYSPFVQEIVVEEGITSISAFAFLDCKLCKKISIADSVKKIGHCAFEYWKGYDGFVLGKNITTLGAMVFHSCDFNVYYEGSKADFAKINKLESSGYTWSDKFYGSILYYSATKQNGCWRYVNGVPTAW